MLSMKLSQQVIEGLQYLGNVITNDISKKLISNTIKIALHPEENIPSNPEIYASNPGFAKQSEFAVISLFFIAIKYDYNGDKLRNFLEEHSINTVIIEELIEVYETNREKLSIQNFQIGHSFPHITDVEWKTVCDVKSSMSNSSSGELSFHIDLGTFKDKTGERTTIVDFICNTEELQSFINKLKEIQRHCEKIANVGVVRRN